LLRPCDHIEIPGNLRPGSENTLSLSQRSRKKFLLLLSITFRSFFCYRFYFHIQADRNRILLDNTNINCNRKSINGVKNYESFVYTVDSFYLEHLYISNRKLILGHLSSPLTRPKLSLSRSFSKSNKFFGPLRVRGSSL